MFYGVLFSLPGLYQACRFVSAERRALRETRDALSIIREDTARRLTTEKLATEKPAGHEAGQGTPGKAGSGIVLT